MHYLHKIETTEHMNLDVLLHLELKFAVEFTSFRLNLQYNFKVQNANCLVITHEMHDPNKVHDESIQQFE